MYDTKKQKLGAVTPPPVTPTSSLCLCRTLAPLFWMCRITGLFPISWSHLEERCVYRKSNFWMAYSMLVTAAVVFQLANSVDFVHLTTVKALPIMMNDITEAIYGGYVIILLLIFFYRSALWVQTLNKFQRVFKHNIFCQSAMRQCFRFQKAQIGVICGVLVIVCLTLTYLNSSKSYNSKLGFNIFANKLLLSVPFMLYVLFIGIIIVFLGMFACFERLLISTLRYRPVHPMRGIDETNNKADFFGVVGFELCKGAHPCGPRLAQLGGAEAVEFLRVLHEEVSLLSYAANACLNPQLLCHTVVELAVLIVHWYAVIAYLAYDFRSPLAGTIHVMNCLFVLLHTFGLFFFMKYAQMLKNMVSGLTGLLLEYSTRASSTEEHQQIRLFIEKLQKHHPISASGVFNVDLAIAGPISANILTYVLVALQFEIPKEE